MLVHEDTSKPRQNCGRWVMVFWLTEGWIPLLSWQGAPMKNSHKENLDRFHSPSLILSGVFWRGYSSLSCLRVYIPERKGLAAPAMVVGRSISPAGSPCCVGEHTLYPEVPWDQTRAQTPQCTCFACTVVTVTWSLSATWADPLPAKDLPLGPPLSRGSTAEAGMTLMSMYDLWTED